MKRLVMLGGVCLLLGALYADWRQRQRRRVAREQGLKLDVWEAEGGSVTEARSEPEPMSAPYS
jgi:hypothetical protein